MEITDTFDEPYSLRTNALPSTFSPSVIGIAGVPYLIDTSNDYVGVGRFKREAFDVVQNRNTNSQRDLLLLPADVWRQQAESWHLGAGQLNLDRDDALQYRYEDSFGIDPWTRWQISLLPETALLGNDSYEGTTWLTTYGSYLAAVNNQTIYWYDELSASATASTTVPHAGHAIVDIANTGALVTTLHDDGKVYLTAGPSGTPSLKGTWAGANFIAYEKDYLLLGEANKLYDITAGGAGTLIYTHPVSSFRWESAAPGNGCIYLIGGVADHYVIHRINIKADGTGFNPCIVAATLPDGEIAYTIEEYLGYVLIGTNKGIRVAQSANTNGDLTLGPIIPTDAAVHCFEGQDRFVWYGNSSMTSTYSATGAENDYFPTGTVPGLGRMDLSVTTTSALSPAYANDLAVLSLVDTGTTRSVVTFNGKRVFSIDDHGIYYATENLMEAGWLKQGTFSFSVEDPKTGLYIQGKWLPLPDGSQIAYDMSYDSTGYIRIVDISIPNSIRSSNVSLNGVKFSRVQPRYVLSRSTSDTTTGPEMTRWEVRAIPQKGKASRWTLPIMNYEDIDLDGVKYTRDPLAVLDTLINLVETSAVFTLQESGRAYQVHAKDFTWTPEKLTINGRSWQGTFTLVVEEVQ